MDNSIPVLQEVLVPGHPTHARATPAAAPSAVPPAAPATGAEPADGVTVHSVTAAQIEAFELSEPPAPFELPEVPEPFEPSSAFHFARASSAATPSLDADVIADRLRGRFASYLTGEGRAVIEARCRDALQDHTTWLVSQITREVALALETEMTGWVREAVEEELARRSNDAGLTSK
ncbi:DUF2486 family protein [Paraburkholderia sp. DHOC27]|nr:DUF2486 family protein [Paraburkholderia sp. DHOC27]